jgi:hypothetical protein
MAAERQVQTEDRIRAAINQLLAGNVPEGLKCDVKSLCVLAKVPRATLYRTYPHLKAEFEQRLGNARNTDRQPGVAVVPGKFPADMRPGRFPTW